MRRRKSKTLKNDFSDLLVWLLFGCLFLGAWTYTYDCDTPLGSDAPSVIDDRIRETKDAVQERMDIDHYWPLTGSQVSAADAGKHRYVTFQTPNDLTTMVADESAVFSKDVSAVTELHWIDESDNVLQLTSGGTINITSADLVGTLANNTYFTAVDAAGTGTANLIMADANDDAVIAAGAELSSTAAPTTDQGIANKKYVDDSVITGLYTHSGAALNGGNAVVTATAGTYVTVATGLSARALCYIKIQRTAGGDIATVTVRDADENSAWDHTLEGYAGGCAKVTINTVNNYGAVVVPCNASGDIEITTNASGTDAWKLWLMGYIP